jgi:hypothetical protein
VLVATACAVLGFLAGVAFAVFFPLGLYFRRLVFWWRGPVPFEVGGETFALGPDDTLHWDVAAKRQRKQR